MIRRVVLALMLALGAPALAQQQAPASAAPAAPLPATTAVPAEAAPAGAETRAETALVRLETSAGPILIEVETERAPVTSANFLRYVEEGRLDGATFYRAVNVAEGYGLIQGGARQDPERVLPPIAHEPTTTTGLSHVSGTISMARGTPGDATGDFFIVLGDMPSLDANPEAPGDNQGFAAFGRVAEGMDTLRRILAAPTDPNEGEGVMKGQMLAEPVEILGVERVE